MARQPIQIDRDKLRAAVRNLGNEYIFYMLDDAIELLPPAKLYKLVKKYLDLKRLRPDAEPATTPSLLKDVRRFEKASLAGEYYQSFFVNSKNYTEQSAGTSAWIVDYLRLLERCMISTKENDPREVGEAMDTLFGLLDHIDECLDDIIFFVGRGRLMAGRSGLGRRCCRFGSRSSRPLRGRRSMPNGSRPCCPATTATAATRCFRLLAEQQPRHSASPSQT